MYLDHIQLYDFQTSSKFLHNFSFKFIVLIFIITNLPACPMFMIILRFVMLSTLIKEESLSSGYWLMERLITCQSIKYK